VSYKDVVQLQPQNFYPKGQVDPDNQRPDKWNSTVVQFETFIWVGGGGGGGGRKRPDTTFKAGDYKGNLYIERSYLQNISSHL